MRLAYAGGIMAKVREFDQSLWKEWVATRPESVQSLSQQLPPDRLYRLKSSGHRGTIHSYSEDGTVTIEVTGAYNLVIFERCVFGIKPEDLEECDLPTPDEPLGVLLTKASRPF
jgi:hypothetical protein